MALPFPWHAKEASSVAHELNTDLDTGLSNKEAASRLAIYGPNRLPDKVGIPWITILLRIGISLMIPLIALAVVILALSYTLTGVIIISGLIFVRIILSGLLEVGSERLLCSLKKLASNLIYAKVLRNGQVSLVKAVDLVPGDIICFEAGEQIAADSRLIETNQLIMDESIFNETKEMLEKNTDTFGEDLPLHPVYLRRNMVFMGSIVFSGSGRAVVTSTGAQTQIAQMQLEREKQNTQHTQRWLLEAMLSKKGIWFASGCIVFSAILWLLAVLFGLSLTAGAMISLSFMLAIWPMGLIEAIRLALTIGMRRLSKHNIIIRRFTGAETLASTTVVCSNKTGVMTQNQMTVKKVFVDGCIIGVTGDGYDPESGGFPPDAEEENPDLPLLLSVAAMSTNAEVQSTPEGWSIVGDPTEGALVVAAMKGGISKDEIRLSLTKVAELSYDPERKRMSMVFRASNDELFIFTRGFLDPVLSICNNMQLHRYVDSLDIGRQNVIRAVNQNFAKSGMHSLAFAYCQLVGEPGNYTFEELERDLIFVGMVGISDPLRVDTKSAVKKCIRGGVKPILFTDDQADMSFTLAKDLELADEISSVVTDEHLDMLEESNYCSLVEDALIYSDISPSHKLKIVRALKEGGEVTAVISNQIGDEHAIREANVGIASCPTCPSVIINSSDIVLNDGSFATAIESIEKMRGAYGNAKRIFRYFLSGNIAMSGVVLIALIINIFWKTHFSQSLSSIYSIYMPFLYVLWINLLAINLPALSIAFNPVTEDFMKEGPYPLGVLSDEGLKIRLFIRGLLTVILTFIIYAFSLVTSNDQSLAITAAFTMLIISQLAFIFQCRCTSGESFLQKFLTNKLLLGVIAFVLLLHLSTIYLPSISLIFGTKPLLLVHWIPILVGLAISLLPLDDLLSSYIMRNKSHDRAEETEEVLVDDTSEDNTPVDSDETINHST